jgi:hypothetical protein
MFVIHLVLGSTPATHPIWSVRLLARTLGFHPGKTGSIPVRITKMTNLVSAIDALRLVLQTEASLRQAADIEWAAGNQNGPMKQAHDATIQQVLAAAQNLIALSRTV